jgi:hypothetical protein
MHSDPLPARVLLLLVPMAVMVVWLLWFNRTQRPGDYIDDRLGRGSIPDDWGLDALLQAADADR